MGQHSSNTDKQFDEEEFKTKLIKNVLPAIITSLLSKGVIEKEKALDIDYVSEKINESISTMKLPKLQVSTYEVYRESISSEINAGREESAIVLASLSIEHLINMFYQDILPYKYSLSDNEVGNILKRLNIPDKINWFFKVSTELEIPEKLKTKISNIYTIRNRIVHYSAIPEDLEFENSGSYNDIQKKMKGISIAELDSIIENLDKYLNEVFLTINKDYAFANTICEKYFLKINNIESNKKNLSK